MLQRRPCDLEQKTNLLSLKVRKAFGRNIYRVGLVINPSCPFLGCSPDRRVYDPEETDGHWGLLEFKCTIAESVSQCECLKIIRNSSNNKLQLKKTHLYYYQVMGQMRITCAKWCDFFANEKSDFFVDRIYFDEELFNVMIDELAIFFFMYFLSKM